MKNTFNNTSNTESLMITRRILAGLALLAASGCAGDDVGDTGSATTTTTSTSTTGETTGVDSNTEGTTTGTASGMSDSDSTTASTEETATESDTSTDSDTMGSLCGDGVVDDGEACDDGVNDGAYDGCAVDCSALGPSCGDGEVNGPEGCDDGNDIDDDACSNSCAAAGCGDGVLQDGEQCDDGNDDDTDACLSTCVPASCGDGFVQADVEECDDGNDVDSDACLSSCAAASCGDSVIYEGVELCDDGVNDGAYDGCAVDCSALGPRCGDGEVNGPETCDDNNDDLTDGCLANCSAATTCLVIKEFDDSATDGTYTVAPEGIEPFEVHCDMTTDGGGYSFLKLSGPNHYASQAEAECDKYGMNLFIPRTLDHKNSAWAIANDANIGPDASANYMYILGIYPKQNGATCVQQPMNSSNMNCGWKASDDGPWYVHEVNNITEPNGDNNVAGSMYYSWQGNGNIQWHNDIGGNGYASTRYMCDFGDKQ